MCINNVIFNMNKLYQCIDILKNDMSIFGKLWT